jgi:hypothetical protein
MGKAQQITAKTTNSIRGMACSATAQAHGAEGFSLPKA